MRKKRGGLFLSFFSTLPSDDTGSDGRGTSRESFHFLHENVPGALSSPILLLSFVLLLLASHLFSEPPLFTFVVVARCMGSVHAPRSSFNCRCIVHHNLHL